MCIPCGKSCGKREGPLPSRRQPWRKTYSLLHKTFALCTNFAEMENKAFILILFIRMYPYFFIAMSYAGFNLVNIIYLFILDCYICTGFKMFRFRIILKLGKRLTSYKCTNCVNLLDPGSMTDNSTRINLFSTRHNNNINIVKTFHIVNYQASPVLMAISEKKFRLVM